MVRLALVASALLIAFPAAASPSSAKRASCTVGVTKTAGVTVQDFCGPASAVVHYAGKTYTIRNGSCRQAGPIYSIRIGSITLGKAKPKYQYFGADVLAPHGGNFKNAAISFQYPGGSGFLWQNALTLSADRKHGTFSGWTSKTPKYVTGTFTCT